MNAKETIKPSSVPLFRGGVLPLMDTFGRAELEFAAALMLRVCVCRGDVWLAMTTRDVGEVMREDAKDRGIWAHLSDQSVRTEPRHARPRRSRLRPLQWRSGTTQ